MRRNDNYCCGGAGVGAGTGFDSPASSNELEGTTATFELSRCARYNKPEPMTITRTAAAASAQALQLLRRDANRSNLAPASAIGTERRCARGVIVPIDATRAVPFGSGLLGAASAEWPASRSWRAFARRLTAFMNALNSAASNCASNARFGSLLAESAERSSRVPNAAAFSPNRETIRRWQAASSKG